MSYVESVLRITAEVLSDDEIRRIAEAVVRELQNRTPAAVHVALTRSSLALPRAKSTRYLLTMRKLKLELDADELSIPVEYLGELFAYAGGVCMRLSDHPMPLAVHQPATAITDAYGHKVGSWHVTDGKQTDGSEPGNGLARLEAERLARAQ